MHALMAALMLAGALLASQSQQTPAKPAGAAEAAPMQDATVASLNDALLARATSLYYSTAKTGLNSFDCQVHPDWNKIVTSARKGAASAADDRKLALLSGVKMTLHGRLKGGSSLDWEVPASGEKPLEPSETAMLEQVHRGMQNTWEGLLKLWTPLVDGSVAESLGEEDVVVTETQDGYVLRSKDRQQQLSEEFDRNLVLKTFIAKDSGSTVNIAPTFRPTGQGLLLSSFVAHIQPAGTPAESAQQMNVDLEYQAVGGVQIPGKITVDVPNVVQMDFALDGCTVNAQPK